MLQAGKSIVTSGDKLMKLTTERLYHAIRSPKPEIESAIRQLRLLLTIDAKRYGEAKKQLPYFVCGIFNPPIRRSENFAWISHFILDFDHLNQKGYDTRSLKNILSTDLRVKMIFISPGGEGLKVMFKLSERCYDRAIYSMFYKQFAASFAKQHHLSQILDAVTNDVTRACFISTDADVYYNPNCQPIEIAEYLNLDSCTIIKEAAIDYKLDAGKTGKSIDEVRGPDEDALLKIKQRLNPNIRVRPAVEKQYYVPAEVDTAVEEIEKRMTIEGITINTIRNISYGKKLTFRLGFREAEINLFYGRRGYSVVQSMRTGTSKELNEVCAAIINDVLWGEKQIFGGTDGG